MSAYEKLSHGTTDFPIGIHDTHYNDGFWLYPHIHREFEFLVLTKGEGYIFIDGQKFDFHEGDGVFVNSKSLHLGSKADENDCRFFAKVFAPEMFGRFGNDAVMDKYVLPVIENKICFPVYYSRNIPWQKRILDLAENIHDANTKKLPYRELLIKECLFNIWRSCLEHSSTKHTERTGSLKEMVRAMEYIRREYASPLKLKDIAAEINMSEGHFCRKFSEIMHITPFEYLLRIRIDNSCRMLQGSDLPVGQIATECGFNGFSYFSKKFKEFVGCTPLEYKKKHNARP